MGITILIARDNMFRIDCPYLSTCFNLIEHAKDKHREHMEHFFNNFSKF